MEETSLSNVLHTNAYTTILEYSGIIYLYLDEKE